MRDMRKERRLRVAAITAATCFVALQGCGVPAAAVDAPARGTETTEAAQEAVEGPRYELRDPEERPKQVEAGTGKEKLSAADETNLDALLDEIMEDTN